MQSDMDLIIILPYRCCTSLLSTGFLEMGESTAAGAARETWEEANARVEVRMQGMRCCLPEGGPAQVQWKGWPCLAMMLQIMAPYAHWDIPIIGQSYLLFRARLAAPFEFSPGEESLETRMFDLADIPFSQVICGDHYRRTPQPIKACVC